MPNLPDSEHPAAQVRGAGPSIASTTAVGGSEIHAVRSVAAEEVSAGASRTSIDLLKGNEAGEAKSVVATQPGNLLHGVKLDAIVTALAAQYGWQELGQRIPIRCFTSDPSVASSLKFLRRTPWAREKVESLYLFMRREARRAAPPVHNFPPAKAGKAPQTVADGNVGSTHNMSNNETIAVTAPAPPARKPG